MALFSTRKVFHKEEAAATRGRRTELQPGDVFVDKDGVGAPGNRHGTLILFFFLEWKVLHPLLWDSSSWAWAFETLSKRSKHLQGKQLILSFLKTLEPRGGFHISTAVSLVLVQLERLMSPHWIWSVAHLTLSLTTSASAIKRQLKQIYLLRESNEDRGQIYVKLLLVWSPESLFMSLEGANKDTKYEFMALLCGTHAQSH